MTRAATVKRLDAQLAPLGFTRKKLTWNRTSGRFVDVVDLQISKEGDALTVNAGVADPEVYAGCWGHELARPVDEPSCTVRSRVGRLLGELDTWWRIDDPDTPGHVVGAVAEAVLPFIRRMHTRAAMIDFLGAEGTAIRGYPPPIIYAAILRDLGGDRRAACAILNELRGTVVGAWKDRVVEIATHLDC